MVVIIRSPKTAQGELCTHVETLHCRLIPWKRDRAVGNYIRSDGTRAHVGQELQSSFNVNMETDPSTHGGMPPQFEAFGFGRSAISALGAKIPGAKRVVP